MHRTLIALLGIVSVVISLYSLTPVVRGELPRATPEQAGMDAARLQRIDDVVAEGLANRRMPGCVVCIGRQGKIVFQKAYGHRQLVPTESPMTVDTVFDMASVTKPVATATSVMMLVESGQVRLRDRVSRHLPEFGKNGKRGITVLDLLVHQGGLIPDNALRDYEDGWDEAYKRICALELQAEPGTKFIYTDVGYIVLAELVRRKTGQTIHEFTRERLFQPLGMDETGYLPNDSLRRRAVTTEQREGRWMQGEVHDPRAYLLGGVAGHAGLFSTARDLAVYAQMMLGRGQYRGTRVLSPATVARMTAPHEVSSGVRGLGWDKQTGYSSNRGELFSTQAFGHGGFTGNAFWIDPELDLFVIFLSNRVHPDGKGAVNPLAGRIGTIAAAAIVDRGDPLRNPPSPPSSDEVLTGIDVLQRDEFHLLAGQRIGLITNHTGINRDGISDVQILHTAANVELAALFSPEHGFTGTLEQAVIADTRDQATGIKIHSLYGATRRPTGDMLDGLDTLVFDIQDIGTRFYTYVSTMGEAMHAAAEHGLRFVVLDRPNPINGRDVAGPVLDSGQESFVGFHQIAVRHGMTVGELARMFNDELNLDLDLEIVRVVNWRRSDFFDATGLLWVNPSPNMRNLNQALLYPGIGLLETTNLSVGRGTDTPFEVIGAPWIDPQRLSAALNRAGLPGIRFVPLRFVPEASKFAGEMCGGINLVLTNRERFQPLTTGWEIARQLALLYPDAWNANGYQRLLADEQVLQNVRRGAPAAEIEAGYQEELDAFLSRRAKYLIYGPSPGGAR